MTELLPVPRGQHALLPTSGAESLIQGPPIDSRALQIPMRWILSKLYTSWLTPGVSPPNLVGDQSEERVTARSKGHRRHLSNPFSTGSGLTAEG